jgi:AraC-like DNA-binding protein
MPQPLQLKYLRPGMATYPPGARFGPRRLPDYELVWIVSGRVVYQRSGEPDRPASAGSVILCRPCAQDGFIWDPEHSTKHGFFHFDIHRLPEDWPSPRDWPFVWQLPDQDVVRPLLRFVVAQPYRNDLPPTHARAVETLLSALLLGPLSPEASGEALGLPQPVERALQHVQRGLDQAGPVEAPDLGELAAAANVSKEHLCRLFRASLNVSPLQAAQLMRLDWAVGLLARSDLSIKEVAHRSGFVSPYHFSRRFRRVYGRSPSELRDAVMRGELIPSSQLVRGVNPPRE